MTTPETGVWVFSIVVMHCFTRVRADGVVLANKDGLLGQAGRKEGIGKEGDGRRVDENEVVFFVWLLG